MKLRFTKADGRRWFDQREGCEVTTCQVRPDGMVWEPGPRVITRKATDRWALDDSTVRLTPNHVVLMVDDDRCVIEWLDADGVTIHVTTYRDVYHDDEEDEA